MTCQPKYVKDETETEASEGVNYHISVDGVTVNIKATKGKTKEADRILEEVKKILMTK